MTTTSPSGTTSIQERTTLDLRLEVVVIPVSDVDRAKAFYESLDFRLDADFAITDEYRIVQLTPPGSSASIIFGTGVTSAAPGSIRELQLVTADIERAHAGLVERGVEASAVFHDATGAFHHADAEQRVEGAHPDRASYGSFLSFEDPDGNGWIVQEVTTRAPGR
jgi:catechol 2,3-dioxygenase-like lactoylglutathione lyase family enzyme